MGDRGRRGLVAEINVTPLVDVMLVLLIIFMVTAPMMTQGIDVELPRTTNKALRQHEEPLVVTINDKGEVFLGRVRVKESLLVQQLKNLPPDRKKESIYLRADRKVPYGQVVATMAAIKRAGFTKLGMITQPSEKRDG